MNTRTKEQTGVYSNRINIIIIIIQMFLWWLLITLMHTSHSMSIKVFGLLGFCMVMQSIFSMMHECTHGIAFENKKINKLAGQFISIPFGILYSLYAAYHKGHHERNRSKIELADYIFEGESAVAKTALYYFAIMGGNWVTSFVGSIVLPLLPLRLLRRLAELKSDNTYILIFNEFDTKKWNILRLELVSAILFWYAAITIFDWNWQVLAIAYGSLAFTWSSLQWIYHIRTPIHPIEGAYNLRLPLVFRLLILNFNYHLTHHRNPKIKWYKLHDASNQKETQPLWYRYVTLFIPPKPFREEKINNEKKYF